MQNEKFRHSESVAICVNCPFGQIDAHCKAAGVYDPKRCKETVAEVEAMKKRCYRIVVTAPDAERLIDVSVARDNQGEWVDPHDLANYSAGLPDGIPSYEDILAELEKHHMRGKVFGSDGA